MSQKAYHPRGAQASTAPNTSEHVQPAVQTEPTETMCYYDNYKYACQDWKWGNFRQHCQQEYRTGETCGMKMIYRTIGLPEHCAFCEKIEKKERRIAKARSDVARWAVEPHRYRASIEKAQDDIHALKLEIDLIQSEKDRRYANIGNSRRNNTGGSAARR